MMKRRTKKALLDVTEIVKTVDLSPISMDGSGDDVRLRVEILRRGRGKARFTARVWRIEFYRLQPTFPQKDGRIVTDAADERVLVVDENFAEGVSGASAGAVLKEVIGNIEARFFRTGHKG
jgi:hypothetical protein